MQVATQYSSNIYPQSKNHRNAPIKEPQVPLVETGNTVIDAVFDCEGETVDETVDVKLWDGEGVDVALAELQTP